MNTSQISFLRSVALSRPSFALGETGDVATDYPSPPVFSVNELLPALKAERAKNGMVGFGLGVFVTGIGLFLFRTLTKNDRERRQRS